MKFIESNFKDIFLVKIRSNEDMRGSLSRVWDKLPNLEQFDLKQASYVRNPRALTLRGMHFQREPEAEGKLILCIEGQIFDVVVDIRKNSKNFLRHMSLEIGRNTEFQGLLVPPGFAHGYLTLAPDSNLLYFMDKQYSAAHSFGISWNSKQIGINWPRHPEVISSKDANWPDTL